MQSWHKEVFGVPARAVNDLRVQHWGQAGRAGHFEKRYPTLGTADKRDLLVQAMSPALHWTPVGLLATRMFLNRSV